MKVAIAGSRRLPKGQAPRLLIRFLAAIPEDSIILMRRSMQAVPGPFEADVAQLCMLLHLLFLWHEPKPDDHTVGRASVYLRDIEMIEEADLVLLFFHPDEATSGYSGTAHLLDKCLDAARPVYAYAVAEDGTVTRVGEYDPDHLYGELAPSA